MDQDLTSIDADYYRKYIALCEEFILSEKGLSGVQRDLKALNNEYQSTVSPNTIRDTIIGDNLIRSGYISDLTERAWENSNC